MSKPDWQAFLRQIEHAAETEVDFAGYNDAKEAFDGHMSLCEKWSVPHGQ